MTPEPSLREVPRPVTFGVFEFHSDTLELKRAGERIRLQELPARLLNALLRNPGDLVTREQLRAELWPSNTFVQFDAGLNTAMNKLRLALRDSAENPRFIETVPRTGYRFVAPVMRLESRAVAAAVPDKMVVLPVAPAVPPTVPPAEPPTPPLVRSKYWRWFGLAAITAICAAAALLSPRSPKRSGTPLHFVIDLPPGQEFRYYSGRQVAISRDGATIAWIAAFNNVKQIYARKLNGGAFWPLADTGRAASLGFSPAGDWLAYISEAGELRKASVNGRWNVKIVDLGPNSPTGNLVWGADGWIYFVADRYRAVDNTRRIFRVRAEGGEPQAVLPDPQPSGTLYPLQWLPRGLMYTANYGPGDRTVNLWVPGERKTHELVQHASGGRYLPSGHLIFDQAGNLMAVPYDLQSRQMQGKPVMVASDVAPDRYAGLQMDLSDTGTLVYFHGSVVHERQPVWVDKSGRETPASLPAGRYRLLDMAADGRILVARYTAGDNWTMSALQPDRSVSQEILSADSPGTGGVFSPDGRTVALTAAFQNETLGTLYLKPVGVSGGERPLLGASYAARYAYSWSQAANAIAYAEGYYEKTKRDVYVLPLRPGGAPECVACTRDNETLPSFSPDGHWIAYTNDHSSRHEIWVQRYPGSPAPVRVSSEGGENSLWAPSGREIFYRWKNEVWAVGFDPATGKPGKARLLFSGKYERGDFWNRDWLISPDGTRFLMLKIVDDPPDYRRIQVIVNWFEELRTSVKGS